jgi:hypothetical protein
MHFWKATKLFFLAGTAKKNGAAGSLLPPSRYPTLLRLQYATSSSSLPPSFWRPFFSLPLHDLLLRKI